MNVKRPKHLALQHIRLPLPGFVSILHRISGALLFLALPLLLLMLQSSLRSPAGFDQLHAVLAHPLSKLLLLTLLWSWLYHLCAGLRYLAIDLHYVSNLAAARLTSKIVLVVSLVLTALFGRMLW